MKSTTLLPLLFFSTTASAAFLPLLFFSTTASAALLQRAVPQDPSFPARIRRSTQKAHIVRSPSPQGPPSNPGEFIDPGLSRTNPRNNPPPPLSSATYAASGPSAANYEYASVAVPVATSPVSAAVSSSAPPAMRNMSHMDMNSTAPDMKSSEMMNSTNPNLASSTMPDMPDPTDTSIDNSATTSSNMDTVGLDNSTSALPPDPSDQHHYHHHHHHNHTHNWNGTLYYNSTDDSDYIDTIYPNGTETVAIVPQNTTEEQGPYPYENGTHHHHHHHHHGNRTQDYGGPTLTGYAVLPGQTGSGPERVGAGGEAGGPGVGVKPGFTGPEARRGREGMGRGRRWLSGIW
ncbi:hypothetical protein N7G274_000945 [Stereocaulon virgatum]|uniref:Uncharacterized protein n=1 Tax=Stereocaulon virgatum TaxID=373712 RepID=A0ABR4AMF5_9LECA